MCEGSSISIMLFRKHYAALEIQNNGSFWGRFKSTMFNREHFCLLFPVRNGFPCLFPWHLHTFNLFCLKNDIIITLNWTDSSHYIKLLYKGKVACSCTIYIFTICQKRHLTYRCFVCACIEQWVQSKGNGVIYNCTNCLCLHYA